MPSRQLRCQHDDVVPFEEGAAIAAEWPNAEFIATEGLGHGGALRDPGVVTKVVRFVTGVQLVEFAVRA